MTEDEMVGWHYQFNGCEFEQTPGESGGQGILACYSPWGHRVVHDLGTKQQLLVIQRHGLHSALRYPDAFAELFACAGVSFPCFSS